MNKLQKFVWEFPDGIKTTIEQWVEEKLTAEERAEFYEARARNLHLREIAIAEGRMVIVDEGYLWKDDEEYDKGKQNDPVWESYWYRWLRETGIKMRSVKTDYE
jgi:hypothetical protein